MPNRKNDYGKPTSGRGAAIRATQAQVKRDGPAAAFFGKGERQNPLPEAKPRRQREER